MKNYWIAVTVAGVLTAGAAAQTGAAGSASANTSVSTGKTSANAGAGAGAQASGSSANTNSNGQVEASQNHGKHQGGDLSTGGSAETAGNVAANGGGAALASGTTLQAELTKSLDAKKAKAGDEVTAKATQDVKSNGHVVVHKGSKLVGHVTEAQARTKDNSESRLGVVFDRAVLKDGSQVTLNAAVQALAVAQTTAPSAGAEDLGIGGAAGGSRPAPTGGGGMLGGVTGAATSTVGSTVGGVGSAAGSVAGSTTGAVGGAVNGTAGAAANGALSSTSRGVIGLKGLTLTSAASGNATGSVISSTTQNVKLDSGTQMVLQVAGGAQQ